MSPYSPLQLAEAFIRTGELADALDALNPHLEANPNDEAALRLRAAVLMRLPGEDYARAALADLARLPEPTAEDFVQQSIIWQMGLGDWQQAVTMTEQAHALAKGDERTAERLLMLYEQTGNLDAARKLVAEQPQNWRWLQLAGDMAQKAGDYGAAAETYTQALVDLEAKLDAEQNAITRNIKGMIVGSRAAAYLKAGQPEAAETDYHAAARYLPTDLSYSLMAGIAAALQGQQERALTLCQSVLNDEPALIDMLREQAAIHPQLEALVDQLNR